MEVTRMRNRTKFTLSIIALALCSSVAIAQEDETGFFAKADTTIAHDDNIYRVTDDLAQSDTYLSVAPELKLIGGFGKQRFELNYTGDYSRFADNSDANFSDHDIRGNINLDHTIRFSSRFEAGYQKEHEEPGSINRIQLDITEYNKYEQRFFLAGLAYGQESSIGRISLNYRQTSKDYLNNDIDFLDYDSEQFTTRFTYRIAPKTKIYLEAMLSNFDYKPAESFELDNTFKRYRAGLTWDFTNKLTGDINIGFQDRDYDLDTIRDIDGLAYNGEITWSINSYTRIDIAAKRESVDSTLEEAGGFLRTSYSLSLKHSFTELLTFKADAGYATDELVFSSAREDNRYAYKVALEYDLLRYMKVGTFFSHEERDSTNLLAEYKANIIGLNVTISLDD